MTNDITKDEYRPRGTLTKIKDFFRSDEIEEEYEEEEEREQGGKRQPVTLRLHSPRVSHVAVRQPRSFEDARIAADGLKDGRQQIINLEKSNPAMSERIIDFLSGVTYALNGFVEKVGDNVYLFAPSNVVIDMPDELHKVSLGLFDENQ